MSRESGTTAMSGALVGADAPVSAGNVQDRDPGQQRW